MYLVVLLVALSFMVVLHLSTIMPLLNISSVSLSLFINISVIWAATTFMILTQELIRTRKSQLWTLLAGKSLYRYHESCAITFFSFLFLSYVNWIEWYILICWMSSWMCRLSSSFSSWTRIVPVIFPYKVAFRQCSCCNLIFICSWNYRLKLTHFAL